MLRRLIPQEYDFFTSFEQSTAQVVVAAKLLLKLTENYADADPIAREIEAIEHACDEITHNALDKLNKVFITPLDREDIHAIIIRLDDVVDLINTAAGRMAFLDIGQPTPFAVNMAKQIVRGCEKMDEAIHALRSPKSYGKLTEHCIAIHDVENATDDIFHDALASLFKTEKDAIAVIKWKDIYEMMEAVTDRQEMVANVLHGVIVKMS
jgi:predicted phosphate transport protein (TIGR00153 family)